MTRHISEPCVHDNLVTATSSASLTLSGQSPPPRAQLQQIGVEVLDIGGQLEFLGDVFVANVAIGDEAHADPGVGIGVDYCSRNRPDFAFGRLDQRTHRAGGVEHKSDFDHGLARSRRRGGLGGPDQWQHKKSESRGPREMQMHEHTLRWKNLRRREVPVPSRRARAGIGAGYGPIYGASRPVCGGAPQFVDAGEAR
jgi:hypothetical protein